MHQAGAGPIQAKHHLSGITNRLILLFIQTLEIEVVTLDQHLAQDWETRAKFGKCVFWLSPGSL